MARWLKVTNETSREDEHVKIAYPEDGTLSAVEARILGRKLLMAADCADAIARADAGPNAVQTKVQGP